MKKRTRVFFSLVEYYIFNHFVCEKHKQINISGTTHGPRTEKVAIVASALSFAGCASSCATRASSALDQRYAFVVVRCVRRDFCDA